MVNFKIDGDYLFTLERDEEVDQYYLGITKMNSNQPDFDRQYRITLANDDRDKPIPNSKKLLSFTNFAISQNCMEGHSFGIIAFTAFIFDANDLGTDKRFSLVSAQFLDAFIQTSKAGIDAISFSSLMKCSHLPIFGGKVTGLHIFQKKEKNNRVVSYIFCMTEHATGLEILKVEDQNLNQEVKLIRVFKLPEEKTQINKPIRFSTFENTLNFLNSNKLYSFEVICKPNKKKKKNKKTDAKTIDNDSDQIEDPLG